MAQEEELRQRKLYVFDLSDDEEEKFRHLLSQKAEAAIVRRGGHGFGVAISDGDELAPAGVLVFSDDLMESEEEDEPMVEIVWLYVDEEYRGMGVGRHLMELFSQVINGSDVSLVVCDVPLASDFDALVGYLGNWGFDFYPVDTNEYNITWMDILDNRMLSGERVTSHTLSLSEITDDALSMYFRKLQIKEWTEFALNESDKRLSCICIRDGEPVGVFLIRREPADYVEPILLYVKNKDKWYSKNVKELLYHALNSVPTAIRNFLTIHVLIRSMEGAVVWDKIFPFIKPPVIRRGINDLKEVDNAEGQ